MVNQENRKKLAFFMVLCLIFSMMTGFTSERNSAPKALAKESFADHEKEDVISIMSVTGSAITYYVGGFGASNTNSGSESTAPFSTLARATQVINGQGAGDYEIIVQGNTTETERSLIGDGAGAYNVAIHTVTGSAIVLRAEACTGDLITVRDGAELVLGDTTGKLTSNLILDGGAYYEYDLTKGCFINVESGGGLSLYPNVILQNSYNFNWDYRAYGAAIYNNGTLLMYGGIIQNNLSNRGSGVYNNGLFLLYDGIIQDNHRASYGSGVYNNKNATFEMYGGFIRNNDADSYAGGVANDGTFKLAGGSIEGNYANSNGGVYNGYDAVFEMTGGSITNNIADYLAAGIYNLGRFTLSGGTISRNSCTLGFYGWGSSRVGGIYNYSEFFMSGGVIEENTGEEGGAIFNGSEGIVDISSGIIRNNVSARGGAVYNMGELSLSGDIEIPAGSDSKNDIYLVSPINIRGNLTGYNTITLTLDNYTAASGSQWIKAASADLIAGNYERFVPTNTDYTFNSHGIIEYTGLPKLYYVGGTGASDLNDGKTSDKPFETLSHAFEVGNDGETTFILQSDQEINRPIDIKGNITIKSDESEHRVSRATLFNGNMMFNITEGSILTLGDSLNKNTANKLIIDGTNSYNPIFYTSNSALNLYSGVKITNNEAEVITNKGTFNMYGGMICDNSSDEEGIINNLGIINMMGGSLCNNAGIGIYNGKESGHMRSRDTYIGTVHMYGGSIYSNIADLGNGIYNEGTVTLSGDASFPVVNDKQDEIYLANANSSIILEGSLINSENIIVNRFGYNEVKILYGEEGLIKNNYHKFILKNPNYQINEQGFIQYGAAKPTYYVNAFADDGNPGSLTEPFATLERAMVEIGDGIGTIVLQSDITITKPVVINGTITLLSDGQKHTIYRGENFESYRDINWRDHEVMFLVYGELKLGKDIGGSDLSPLLVIDGGSDNGISATDAIITNYGYLNLNAGIILQNNYSEDYSTEAIHSYGDVTMSGGTIQNIGSDYYGSVIVAGGSYTMNAGSIRDNIGNYTGVYIKDGTFIMNGGTIRDNHGPSSRAFAGVQMSEGSFIMNGGEISGNDGYFAGVYTSRGSVNINGGRICENKGSITGIAVDQTEIQISGGIIANNSGALAGVLMMEGTLELSGNADIGDGDQIILFDDDTKPTIQITAPLTNEAQRLEVSIVIGASADDVIPCYELGRQVLQSGKGYTYTAKDRLKFDLASTDYAINPEGKIATRIKANWVTVEDKDFVYQGTGHAAKVEVKYGEVILREDIDYTLGYANNTYPGIASATVVGIGAYGGVVVKNFNIRKARATGIISQNPPTQTYSAKDHKTAQDLLNSIAMDYVTVSTDSGLYYNLPIQWRLTQGTYDPKGGTYIYTGEVIGDANVVSYGAVLTAQIIVLPEEPYLKVTLPLKVNSKKNVAEISFYNAGSGLNVVYKLPDDWDQSTEDRISLPISSQELLKQFEQEEFTALNITISLSNTLLKNSEFTDLFDMLLDVELLKMAKELNKDITVSIVDESGKERYSWTFTGENLKNSTQEMSEVNLTIGLKELEQADELQRLYAKAGGKLQNIHGLVIAFGHNGVLPAQADIRIYVGDREGITPGSTIYLYHYNEATNKLDTLPFSSGYVVDKDGYITIHILHCSDYVILMEEADKALIASLRSQIHVSVGRETLYASGSVDTDTYIHIDLPETLELVDSFETNTSQEVIGGVTVTFSSSKENVATVDDKGKITAKGTGYTTIFVNVKLYSGKAKTFRVYIRVKKAK